MDPEKLQVTVDGGILHVRGERRQVTEEGTDVPRREILYGTIERALTLPDGVDPETVSAHYEGGIL